MEKKNRKLTGQVHQVELEQEPQEPELGYQPFEEELDAYGKLLMHVFPSSKYTQLSKKIRRSLGT